MVKIRHLGRALLGLAALFAFSTGAKADQYITPVTPTADGSTYYVIHSLDRGGVLTQNGDDGTGSGVMHGDFRGKGSLWVLEPISSNTDKTAANGFYLKNKNGKYMTTSCTMVDDQASASTFYVYSYSYTVTVSNTETTITGTVISNTSGEDNIHSNTPLLDASNANANVAFQWNSSSTDYQGTTWLFEAVTDVDALLIDGTTSSSASSVPVYSIQAKRGSAWTATSGSTALSCATPNTSDTYQQFVLLKSDNNNYYLVNVATNQFVSNVTPVTTSITGVQLSDTPQTTTLNLLSGRAKHDYVSYDSSNKTYSSATGSAYFNIYNPYIVAFGSSQYNVTSTASGSIVAWNGLTDEGNVVKFVDVDATYDATAAFAAIKTYEEVTLAYEALQTTITTAETWQTKVSDELYYYSETTSGALAAAITAAKAITTSNTAEEIAAAQTALEEAIAALTFNVPSTGKFYRIKNTATSVYLAATNANSYAGFDASASTSNIFYYDENSYLVNYSTGYRVAANGPKLYFGGVSDAVAITLKAPTNGASDCCNVCYTGSGRNERLYISGSGTDSDPYWANNLDYGDKNSSFISTNLDNFTLEEVTTIPVTIGTSGYGTLYTPVALTIPDGTSVYTGTISSDKKSVELTEVSGTIPAGETVLVAGTAGTSVDFTVTTSKSKDEANESNVLTGQTATIAVADGSTYYTLQTINGANGFAKFNGTTLKGFKGYILNPDVDLTQSAIALRFPDATGINAINAATENGKATIYDLQGRRVQNAARGLYIVNGQKVLVK